MKTINSFRSKLLALTLALVASVSTFAYDYHGDLLCYNVLTDSTVAVTGQSEYKTMPRYEYLPENLVIPSEVTLQGKAYKVVSIDQWAFYACTMLKSVTIPSSVTFIGLSAFQYCENLVNVDIPTSVTTVEGSAFSYTKWYDNLPDGEVYINNTLYRYKGTAPENTQIVVKDGTTRIAGFTFWNQSNIVAIELPQTLTDIEHGAFEGCTQLSSILIPKNVTFIGCSAFAECTGLMEVICLAPTPPIAGVSANPSPSDWMFAGVDIANVRLYVPMESIELYRNADQWKDFQIRIYYGSEECHEYMHVNLTALPLITGKLTYRLSTDDGSEIPYVDSVWILNTDKEPLRKFYAQSGDTIDLLFFERGTYILNVYLNECIKSRTFVHRPKWKYTWCDTWNVMWFDGMRFDETARTSQYRLGKDTVIGDYTYSKFTSRTSVRFTNDRKVYVYYEGFDDNDPYTPDLPTGEYLAYDFSAQVGDTLEVFSGIGTYSTYPCVVDDVQIDSETNLRTMTLHKICRIEDDGFFEEYDDMEMTWIEGVGSPEGFLISDLPCGWVGGGTYALLCAYQGDELKYTGSLYERFGCDYKAGVVSDDLFPTLSGLQRTICREYYEQTDNKTRIEQYTNLTTRTETGAPYIYCSPFLLREKDNKILIYSRTLNKDLVLYDFNLQVGDSLPMLYIDFFAKDDWIADRDMEIWCVVDYHKDLEGNILPADTLIVTDVSAITLLDGKEYKKWTFNNGMEYVEGIGSFGNRQWSGDFFQLIAHRGVPTSLQGEHLICVSKNNTLLYQMDGAEMERLGTECLCQAEQNPEDLFPTLWGLQRTDVELSTIEGDVDPYHLSFKEYTPTLVNGKLYLCDGRNYFREENNQVLLYAPYLGMEEDLVLYDWTLEVGDTLPYKPKRYTDEQLGMLFRVTDVSTIQLLDGKEYKKWTFSGGYEFVEGIGAINKGFGHFNCLRHTIHTGMSAGERLVCASRNGQLLIDNTEKWGVECQCEIETSYKSQWCNQWNILSHGYQGPQDPLAAARTSIFWLSNNTVNRDGQEYIPLMCSSSKPDVESTNLIGELRFTEDKQVYFYYDNTEYLLYDFDVQVGDTLDIFGGIELYSYSFVEQKTYPHVITKIDTLDDGRLQITSDAIVIFEDGEVGTFEEKQQQIWIEGLGSINGIVHTGINPGIGGNPAIVMLCAYRDDECVYKTDSNDPYWIDYTQLGCVYNEGDFIEGAFPMLSGLQRTVCNEYCGDTEDDNSANNTYKQIFDSIFFENDKPYILCNDYLLREEDNKILIYSQLLNKDLVLYDFTLEVGDSLPALYIYYHARNAMDWIPYNLDVVDYNKDFEDGTIYPADTFVVTDVSNVTLLDGKEYKKWTFDNGMEYVEGIGMYGGHRNGNFFGLIQEIVVPCHTGTHLVCVSKNNQLLYQMDDVEMERLGAECLCDYNSGPKKDNAKNGKIGGRPTPTQWNMLEVETKEMDGTPTILRAETFSYTLENDSIVTKGKTFYQLARQSTKDTAITKSFVGALHFGEDEDNRVYFLRDGVEYVLYDFTAEPGDTIEIFAGINNYPLDTTYTHVVTGKDTLENGACRIMLEVVFPDETSSVENAQKVWLAGLGSIDGIVHNAATRATKARSSETQTSVMLCAWRDDDCLYTTDHPDYDSYGCVYNLPTSIKDIERPGGKYQKIIRDGHLYILRDNKLYDVLGTPMN